MIDLAALLAEALRALDGALDVVVAAWWLLR